MRGRKSTQQKETAVGNKFDMGVCISKPDVLNYSVQAQQEDLSVSMSSMQSKLSNRAKILESELITQLDASKEKIRECEEYIEQLKQTIESLNASATLQGRSGGEILHYTDEKYPGGDHEIGSGIDEEKDDEEVTALFFRKLDKDKSGSISKSELDDAIAMHKNHSELANALQSLLSDSDSSLIDFEHFKAMVRKIPRVSGQRVQWSRSLGLEKALAKYLPPGSLFDGLLGVKGMSEGEIRTVCRRFGMDVLAIVVSKWEALQHMSTSAKKSDAEEANSKFAMTEGAYVGSFGTLDEFYLGPEALIGYPNPKLYDAMFNEHCIRSNTKKIFTTPNYCVSTCPEWEWQWILDPDNPFSPALQARMDQMNNKYPGEVGDRFYELEVLVSIEVLPDTSSAIVRNVNEDVCRWIQKFVLDSQEEQSRGARIVASAAQGEGFVTVKIALPLSKDRFSSTKQASLMDVVKQASCTNVGQISLSCSAEKTWVFSEFVDESSLKAGLSDRLKSSTAEEWKTYLKESWKQLSENDLKLAGKDCIELVAQFFRSESEKWKQSNIIRKQGRKRAGNLSELMRLVVIAKTVVKAKLIKEEIIALRLYTGPMYLQYNAKLRNFPQHIVLSLEGNRYETSIFVITSGITKLSKVTTIPPNRLLYRGLGGMLLPEKFWKPSVEDFQGGVEYGLMSTTTDRNIAIHYSGIDKKRAIIFEILAGRIDIGGSLRFVSQYPGEDEFLMQPLSCLEVMGRPRVEATALGEVVVFPMRVNVNLKSLTVEQLVSRRKELHLAMSTNLREELFQRLDEEVAAGIMDASPASQTAVEAAEIPAQERPQDAAMALEAAERALADAQARAIAAEEAWAKHLGTVELLRGDPAAAALDPAQFTVRFQELCSVGAPQLASASGRIYYEIELLQVSSDSAPHFGFAGSNLVRTTASRGIGEDLTSWAVNGMLRRLVHGQFRVGDRVQGLYMTGRWYSATIEAVNYDGTYLLKWDDGDSKDRVKTIDQLRHADLGTFEEAGTLWGGVWREGDVIGLACDLDRGAMLVSVNGDFSAPNGLAFSRGVRLGSVVGAEMFPAFSGRNMRVAYNLGTDPVARPFHAYASQDSRCAVETVRGDPTQVAIDAGLCAVELRGLCVVGAPRSAAVSGRMYYEVELVQVNANSSLQLGFAGSKLNRAMMSLGMGEDGASWAVDGIRRRRLHLAGGTATLRLERLCTSTEFQVGDRVEGKYKTGKWYPAVIESRNKDGTFLLRWEDGDAEDRVKSAKDLQYRAGDPRLAQQRETLEEADVADVDGGDAASTEEAEWGGGWKQGDVIGIACDLATGEMLVSVNGDYSPPNGVAFADGVRPGAVAGESLFPAFSGRNVQLVYNLGKDPAMHPFRGQPWPGGAVRVIRGDPANAMVNTARSEVDFVDMCIVGAPQPGVTSGRVYYEVELVQVRVDSCLQLGFAGAKLNRTLTCLGMGEDAESWAVDGLRRRRLHHATSIQRRMSNVSRGGFEVGDRVEGRYMNGHWYPAVIANRNEDGTFTLQWADGDTKDTTKDAGDLRLVPDSAAHEAPADSSMDAEEDGVEWGSEWREGDVIGLACDLERGEMLVSVNGDFSAPNGQVFSKGVRPGPVAGAELFPAFSGRNIRISYNIGSDAAHLPMRFLPEGYAPVLDDFASLFRLDSFVSSVGRSREERVAAKAEAEAAVAALEGAKVAAVAARQAQAAAVLAVEVPMVTAGLREEFEALFARQAGLPAETFNNEAEYKSLIIDAIDAKVLALRKLDFFRREVENGAACRDEAARQRIRESPFSGFGRPGIELALRTGVADFPWRDVSLGEPSLDLGDWSPVGRPEGELARIRDVLQGCSRVRGVTLRGQVVSFPQGLLAADFNLNGQPMVGVAEELGFILTISTHLTALSMRGNSLKAPDWRAILNWLHGRCSDPLVLNGQQWSVDLLAGGMEELLLREVGLGPDDAAVIGALLPRSATTLTALDLSGNELGSEGAAAIAYGLSYLCALKILNLNGAGLVPSDWQTVFEALGSRLERLDEVGYRALPAGLVQGSLTELALGAGPYGYRPFGVDDAAVLCALLPRSGAVLTCLDFSNQPLNQEGGSFLAEALSELAGLVSLSLGGCYLARDGVMAVAACLSSLTALETLDLRDNAALRDGGRAVAGILSTLCVLQSLDMGFNALLAEGSLAVANGASRLPSLRSLDLCGNNVEAGQWTTVLRPLRSGAAALEKLNGLALPTGLLRGGLKAAELRFGALDLDPAATLMALLEGSASSLTDLNLGGNQWMASVGAAAVEGLAALTQLRRLELSALDKPGFVVASQALGFLTRLEDVNLSMTPIGRDIIATVVGAFAPHTLLRCLQLRCCSIGVDGGLRMAAVLSRLHTLQELDLGDNDLHHRGAVAVAQSLLSLTALLVLDLSLNQLGEKGWTAAAEVLGQITTLQTILLSDTELSESARGQVDGSLHRPGVLKIKAAP